MDEEMGRSAMRRERKQTYDEAKKVSIYIMTCRVIPGLWHGMARSMRC